MSDECKMRSYQIEGLRWLIAQYNRRVNCILADEMGLGKTLQSIAFLAHILHVRREVGPHLIVVPLSVLFNWIAEFKRWCPSIKVLRFHSNDAHEQARLKALMNDFESTEVVVTTYSLLKSEGVKRAFQRVVWRSVILDEGHKIKNNDALVSNICAGLHAVFKVRVVSIH